MGDVVPWPQQGSEVLVEHYQLRVGGSLGNTALALHALGVKAEYYANVGSDFLGSWLFEELAKHDCRLTRSPGPTAVTVGLTHPDGERTFITHEGHFHAFDVASLRRTVESISPNDLIMLSGYFLLPPLRSSARELCDAVRERGGTSFSIPVGQAKAGRKRYATRSRRFCSPATSSCLTAKSYSV